MVVKAFAKERGLEPFMTLSHWAASSVAARQRAAKLKTPAYFPPLPEKIVSEFKGDV